MIPPLVEQALERGERPRVHPNGFLQLNLTDDGNTRLHIWHPDLPRQITYTGAHDHIFDMQSIVKRGQLRQVRKIYTLAHGADPTDEVYMARYSAKSQSTLEPTGVLVRLRENVDHLVQEGESYTQPAFTFHESIPETDVVVTIMTKTVIYVDSNPRVLVPIGQSPDNSFKRGEADTFKLHRIINEALAL